jgi:hypothetical protein
MGIKGSFAFLTGKSRTAKDLNELLLRLVSESPREFGHPIWTESLKVDGKEAVQICAQYVSGLMWRELCKQGYHFKGTYDYIFDTTDKEVVEEDGFCISKEYDERVSEITTFPDIPEVGGHAQ